MNSRIIKYGWRFLLYMLLQLLVLDQLHLHPLINIFPYVIFILTLPVETPVWLLLLLSFATGLSEDLFEMSIGMHAFSCVLIGFLRKPLLSLLNPRLKEGTGLPNLRNQNLAWFISYAAIMLFIHHLAYSLLENGGFLNFGWILLKVLLSGICSLLLMLIYEFLFGIEKA